MSARRTEKQRIIMRLVLDAMNAGTLLTITELHKLLPYSCTYGALRVSLRFLEEGRAITRERAGAVTVVRPTPEGIRRFSYL